MHQWCDKQVAIFSDDTLINIMQNFCPNKTSICDDREPHGWIKKLINWTGKPILLKFHSNY